MTATQKYKTVAASLLEADHIDRIISYEADNLQMPRRVTGRLSAFSVRENHARLFVHQADGWDDISLDTKVNIFHDVDAR